MMVAYNFELKHVFLLVYLIARGARRQRRRHQEGQRGWLLHGRVAPDEPQQTAEGHQGFERSKDRQDAGDVFQAVQRVLIQDRG